VPTRPRRCAAWSARWIGTKAWGSSTPTAWLSSSPGPKWGVDAVRLDVALARIGFPEEIDYRPDALAVAAAVKKGAVEAAVLLRPVSVSQIQAVADAGERMPEKTTFFQPKPLTGLVFRSLDD
jgi:hypothetical protein